EGLGFRIRLGGVRSLVDLSRFEEPLGARVVIARRLIVAFAVDVVLALLLVVRAGLGGLSLLAARLAVALLVAHCRWLLVVLAPREADAGSLMPQARRGNVRAFWSADAGWVSRQPAEVGVGVTVGCVSRAVLRLRRHVSCRR